MMKRLLMSSLFGCMLMAQVNATLKEFALGFAVPAGIAVTKGALIARIDYTIMNEEGKNSFGNFYPSEAEHQATLTDKVIFGTTLTLCEAFYPLCKNKDYKYLHQSGWPAEKRFNVQRTINLFGGLISCGAIAAGLLFGTKYMPHCIGKLIGSQDSAYGVLVGGGLTLPACLIGL